MGDEGEPGGAFDERLDSWREYVATPWARIRYAVVGEVLRRHTETLGRPLRVLDVGGGDGQDSLPLAQAGHEVTILDPSARWLAEAGRRAAEQGVTVTTVVGGLDDLAAGPRGEWDVVLCHFVLRYRPADARDLEVLARQVRPGGLLSVADVNPAARVLRALVTEGPAAALEVLDAERIGVAMFDTDARPVEPDEILADAERLGLRLRGRYAARTANDLLVDEDAKQDPAFFAQLLALELALCDRPPFRDLGFVWQLVLGH